MKSISEILKKRRIWILSMTILVIIGLFAIMRSTPTDNLKLKFGEINELNDLWTVEELSGDIYTINLPDRMTVKQGETIHLSKVLPADFNQGRTIRIRSSMQNIQVELDGQNIFDHTIPNQNSPPFVPVASAWFLIDIPENHENSVLDLYISTDIAAMTGRLNEIYYGSRGDLIGELMTRNSMGIFVIIFVFSVAIFSFMASLSVNLRTIRRLNYLSLFLFTIGIWLISEMDIMQMFMYHNYFIGTISYLILPIAAIMFSLFICEVAIKKYSKLIKSLMLLIGIYLITSIILQLFLGVDYIEIFPVFIVLLGIIISTIIISLIREAQQKSEAAKKYLLFIFVLFVTVLLEVVMFLIGDFNEVSDFSSIGILIFLILVIFDTIKYLSQAVEKEAESKYLREIAYNDPLTKGLNRAAFERDIDELLTANENQLFRLSMFDLNELKKTNDDYGHEVGDEALKNFYNELINAFDQDATCYRIGGDEFMVIHRNTSEEKFTYSLNRLQLILEQYKKSVGYGLEAAYGTGIYKFEESFGTFKHNVDMKMYNEKNRQKQMKER